MLGERDGKTFCEFFAGIGLVHEALRRSGWKCVYANDVDAKKWAMYEGNYSAGASEHYHLGDVWATDEVCARILTQPFLATASFPCTDMSLAGKRAGLKGGQSGALFGFLQVLERLENRRPQMVLLENVPGFLTSHDGADFATAAQELAALGYWLDSFVIDAKCFVPQSRPRLFLVGYQEGLLGPSLAVKPADDGGYFSTAWHEAVLRADRIRPTRLRAAMDELRLPTGWATVNCGNPKARRNSLESLVDVHGDGTWWDDEEVTRHFEMMFDRHRRQIEALRDQAGPPVVLTGFRRVREGKQRLEVRFDGVAGCLRTPRGGSAKQVVIIIDHPDVRMRWMTPREYARLQGAGDYVLPENTIQGLFGFGDAVCVPVIEWIDRNVLTPVFEGSAAERSPTAELRVAAKQVLSSVR